MNRSRAARLDLGKGLFADRRYHNLKPLRPCRVQHQDRKFPIAGDKPKACHRRVRAQRGCPYVDIDPTHYLITPRSETSINRISISTSSPQSASAFNFPSACDVFSFEASSTRYA